MNYYLKVLKQFANFRDRTSRKEYWMFILFSLIFSMVALALDNAFGIATMGYGPIYLIYTLIVFIPGLAAFIRRLHDVGNSGWMFLLCLIPIIGAIWLLVLICKKSQEGSNKWGENPKDSII